MTVLISSVLLEQITTHAKGAADEICGLLLGTGDAVTQVVPCRNVASEPARRFEIDPAALIAAHRAARNGEPQVIGHYHSHPTGSPLPSPRDAADAAPDGAIWLIVGGGAVRAWRAVASGRVEGRFDPVDLFATD